MRNSPAFTVVQQLPRSSQVKTQNRVDRKQTTDGKNYFHIAPKQTERATFILGGVAYQSDPTRIPHLSVYEKFGERERAGLSVFHYTWYGAAVVDKTVSEDGAAAAAAGAGKQELQIGDRVVVHIYFNQTGAYLYSQVKKESAQAEHGGAAAMAAASAASTTEHVTLTPVEESALRRHALQQVGPAISEILQQVHQQADQARQKTDRSIVALERMSLRNPRERAAYLSKVKVCIRELEALNVLSFTRSDSRLLWMRTLVASTPDQQAVSVAAASSKVALFSESDDSSDEDEAAASAASTAAKPRPKRVTSQQRDAALKARITAQIEAVDGRLQALEADEAKGKVDKATEKHQLLQDKMALIAEGDKHVPGQIVQATFKAIQGNYAYLNELFRQRAIAGDLDAVKDLVDYVDAIDPNFLIQVLVTLNIPVCEFIIKIFDDAIFYVNHIKFADSPSSDSATRASAAPMLYQIFQWKDGLPLIELLLQNGADPNVPDVRDLNQSLLRIAVSAGETGHVKALLTHGARVHARQLIVSEVSDPSRLSDAAVKQRLAKAKSVTAEMGHSDGKLQLVSETSGSGSRRLEESPLADGVQCGKPEVLALLLDHGAYTPAKNPAGFDALGMATMTESVAVHPEIVRLLQQQGANINVAQGPLRMTPLDARAVFGDAEGVRALLALGADQNVVSLGEEAPTGFPSYPLLSAVQNGDEALVDLLLETDVSPLTFTTLAFAMGYYSMPASRQIAIDPVTLEYAALAVGDDSDAIGEKLTAKFRSMEAAGGLDFGDLAKRARITAQLCFMKKQYRGAIASYITVILFCDPSQRHEAYCNVGVSYQALGEMRKARQFYTIAARFNPESQVAKAAAERLAALDAKEAGASAARPS